MKYTLYVHFCGNEGGYAICKTENYRELLEHQTINNTVVPVVGMFDNVDEGAQLLFNEPGTHPDLDSARNDIIKMIKLIES